MSDLSLRIASWNVSCFNARPDAQLAYIRTLIATYDVVGLQEVNVQLLIALRALGYEVRACTSVSLQDKKSGKITRLYNVIVTRLVITMYWVHQLPYRRRMWPPQARLLDWYSTRKQPKRILNFLNNHQALSILVEVGGEKVRIFCAHLTFWRASWREEELTCLLEKLEYANSNIVVGDLNCFDNPRVPWFSRLFAFLTGDIGKLLNSRYSERRVYENLFTYFGLRNVLRGQSTFCKFGNQMDDVQFDHILVPFTMQVRAAGVIKESHGSDHYPVFAEVVL